MIPSLTEPKIMGVCSKMLRVIFDEMNYRICLSIGSAPTPEPELELEPPPHVLITILKSNHTHEQNIPKESSSHSFPRFSMTFLDSSMYLVISIVWAQYYLPHLSILSSRIILNPISHLLKLVFHQPAKQRIQTH